MSPVAASSMSPSSSSCKAESHHNNQDHNEPMTSRLCTSPSALPPTTLLELPVDHQGQDQGRPPLCAGCRLRIIDKFYLCAVEAKWHSQCLKCSDCGVELANQLSCFERDGNIYCKEDYIRWALSNSLIYFFFGAPLLVLFFLVDGLPNGQLLTIHWQISWHCWQPAPWAQA